MSPVTEDIQDKLAEQCVGSYIECRHVTVDHRAGREYGFDAAATHHTPGHDNGTDGSGSASGAHRDIPGPNMSILYMNCLINYAGFMIKFYF